MRAAHFCDRGPTACRRMERRECRETLRVRTHARPIESILPRAGFRLLPIPAEQYRPRNFRRVHRVQQLIDRRQRLHRAAVATSARTQDGPVSFAGPGRPSRRIQVDLGRVKVNVRIDDHAGRSDKQPRTAQAAPSHRRRGPRDHLELRSELPSPRRIRYPVTSPVHVKAIFQTRPASDHHWP